MSVAYRSRKYALLNTPIETNRHVARVVRHLAPREEDRILEIGCGRGFVTRRIQKLCPQTQGVDVNPEVIRHGVAPNLRAMDVLSLEFEAASFDKIYSFHTIEHIGDIARAFQEIERMLRPGGRLLLVYPAEPIRGLFAVPSAVAILGNPLRARELHLHRLTPRLIQRVIAAQHLSLTHLVSEFDLLFTPQFLTVLVKR